MQVQNTFRFAGNMGIIIAPDYEAYKEVKKEEEVKAEKSSNDFFVESLVIKLPPPIAEPRYFSHGVFLTKQEMQNWDNK